MSEPLQIQYVSDAQGNALSVIVPIDIFARSNRNGKRPTCSAASDAASLLDAKDRNEGVSFEDARAMLGIDHFGTFG